MKYYIILMLLVVLAFASSLQNSFVWDDINLIVGNPQIDLPLKKIPSVFITPLWKMAGHSEYRQAYYRPIATIFSILNYKIWGLNPTGFHLTHIILHLVNTIFLYRVGLLLFSSNNNDKFISLIAASIFAVHPVHNESVGRAAIGEVIFGFFVILSIHFFLKEKKYLSWFMFIFALLSKEAAVMLPFALAILAIRKGDIKKGLTAIIPYIVLVVAYLILRSQVVDTVFGDKVSQPIFTRILTMAVATFDYIRLLLIPYPLSPYYPARWYTSIFEPKVLITVVVLALMTYLAFRIRRDKTILFLLSFPFIMLAPVIWRVNTFAARPDLVYIAERFLYVPAMTFSLFISFSAVRFANDKKKKYIAMVGVIIIIVFTVITISSNKIWENDFALFGKIARESPNTVFAHNNLGLAYYERGQLNEAIQEYKIALKLKPNFIESRNNLGLAYAKQGQLNKAIQEFLTVSKINPKDASAHYNLGIAYKQNGLINEAIQEFQMVLKIQPDHIHARKNLESLRR